MCWQGMCFYGEKSFASSHVMQQRGGGGSCPSEPFNQSVCTPTRWTCSYLISLIISLTELSVFFGLSGSFFQITSFTLHATTCTLTVCANSTNTCPLNCLSSCWGNVGGRSIPQPFLFLSSPHSFLYVFRHALTPCVLTLSCSCLLLLLDDCVNFLDQAAVLDDNYCPKTSGMLNYLFCIFFTCHRIVRTRKLLSLFQW